MQKEIETKLQTLRNEYSFLAKEKDNYVFNALVTQCLFFKNPSNRLEPGILEDIIVDGKGDGGIDCILTDLDSDHCDLVFIQCKFWDNITLEDIKASLDKMHSAYIKLLNGKYEEFKEKLVQQYSYCQSDMEEGAITKFILCTSASQSGTKIKSIQNHFNILFEDYPSVKLEVYFEKDITEKIIEFDSLRRTVSSGKIKIDKANNCLFYNESEDCSTAVIVNVSAWSIKELYARHHLALLSQNLRFFVKSKNIDSDINKSISYYKKKFWYKNNGITIVCENFEISGKEIHLSDFSIINGGQTTTLIGKSNDINEKNDFYLPLKIIKSQGENEVDKQKFIFDIAIATNSQKAIKPADLKANEPEQILFANVLRSKEIFYRTKRGENIPTTYNQKEKNLDLPKASKLGLAGIFLMPGTARNKPSIIYDENTTYYDSLFKKNREYSANCIKDLLYLDNYFDTKFKKQFAKVTKKQARVTFANNSRTLALAYCGFLSKYINNELTEQNIDLIANFDSKDDNDIKDVQKVLSNPSKTERIFNKDVYRDLDRLENNLYLIISLLCNYGTDVYKTETQEAIDESNWLKKDLSFYQILSEKIDDIIDDINSNEEKYSIFKR